MLVLNGGQIFFSASSRDDVHAESRPRAANSGGKKLEGASEGVAVQPERENGPGEPESLLLPARGYTQQSCQALPTRFSA